MRMDNNMYIVIVVIRKYVLGQDKRRSSRLRRLWRGDLLCRWWRRLRVQLGLLWVHWRVHVLQPVRPLLLLLGYRLDQQFPCKPCSTPDCISLFAYRWCLSDEFIQHLVFWAEYGSQQSSMLTYSPLTTPLARTLRWNLLWNFFIIVLGGLVLREFAEVDALVFSRPCRLSLNILK